MKLLGKIFLFFTITTFVELYLLLQLTRITSIWVTIALTILSGMIGAYLAKREGLRALTQIGAAARLEQEPTTAVLDSVLLLIGAAFLITPGVITDLFGLLLMIPTVRKPLVKYLKAYIWKMINKQLQTGSLHFYSGSMKPGSQTGSANRPYQPEGEVIDIEVER
jgi:UPF0716 protein FxsA